MKEKRTMFLIPGFGQTVKDKDYIWLKKFLISKNYSVVIVPIKWGRKTISDYVLDFKNFYFKNKTKNDYFLGFSYGAVISLLTATELKPKKIFLCSISPYFKEDVTNLKPWIKKIIGKKGMADSLTRSGEDIAKNLSIPAVVFYGEIEAKKFPQLKKRCEETVNLSKKSKLIVVTNSPHDIGHPEYRKAIASQFK